MGCATAIFFAPWGPGEGSKGQISFNFNYKVNFKDFYTKLCVYTHKWKIQNISDGIFILSPGSCPRGGTWGCLGAKITFRPAVCPLCYLLLNHWRNSTKFGVWVSPINGACNGNFFGPAPLGPWEGSKGQILFYFNYNPISKIFIPNFVCVLTNVRFQTGFSFCCLGHAPGVGLWGAGGAYVVKIFFFKHDHVPYQIDEDDEQNRMQVKFSS